MSRSALPRPVLLACAALVVGSVAGVTAARLGGYSPPHEAAASLVSRELRFADRDDGAIEVTDGRTGAALGRVAQGSDGFVRATMRGLANERKRLGLGPERPFLLSSLADGALTLQDPATGRSLDLRAFGPTNAAAFARFLPPERAAL